MLLLNDIHGFGVHEATTQGGDFFSPIPSPAALHHPSSSSAPPTANYESKISPSILLILVMLAAIFIFSGLLHILVKILLTRTSREPEESQHATSLQGQLQELFQLHDAGVDQSFIDTFPVFIYRDIIGRKDPFDCAVCLTEFEAEDKLRLLPMCSHAFHIDCIDTWLLSHSTCPLCRRSLFPELSPAHSLSQVVLFLESGSETSREILLSDREEPELHSHLGFPGEDNSGSPKSDSSMKSGELVATEESSLDLFGFPDVELVPVKLGKFRNAHLGRGEGSSSGNGNHEQSQRRCFSMGSYDFMLDESRTLQVAIKPAKKKPISPKPRRRAAASDYDCHSRREGFKFVDESKCTNGSSGKTRSATCLRKDSFSFSKIWLQTKEERSPSVSH